MTQITLENIVKHYDAQDQVTLTGYKGRPALDRVSLSVNDGETISVLGPSGCGKSTLLKVVAGLEFPNGGRVLYNGQDVTEIKPQDRGIGFVFQDYALYPTRQGKGNLSYFFEVHKRGEDEQETRLRETAALMGVDFEMLLGQLPDTLSGGQRQRVAIARCIVRDPNIFLMDEPIVNLDAKLRERTRVEVKKLLRRFQVTTLYVTHDQQEAVFMGDRIVVMRAGRIEQVGTFDDLYYTPANAFVATFIGTPPMALLPATVDDGAIRIGETSWALPPALAADVAPGAVRLGVRPEGWRLHTTDGAPIAVRHIERMPTAQASFLHGTLAGATVTLLAPLDEPERAGISATPDWERVYIFAADDERVIHAPGVPELF